MTTLFLCVCSLALAACGGGGGGKKCTANSNCSVGEVCTNATCVVGTGGGSGSTGGSGTTGGGSSTGGGNAVGGSGVTGGGSATTGGGSVSTGGGSATGGGSVATGGGSTTTGGGSTAVGGGIATTGGGSATLDGGNSGGGMVVLVDAGTIVGGETCAMAVTVNASTILMATTIGSTNNMQPNCTGFLNAGPDIAYKITVPAGQALNATVTPVLMTDGGYQYDPSIYFIAAPASNCFLWDGDAGSPNMTCLAGADTNATEEPQLADRTKWINTTGAPAEVFVVLDSAVDGVVDFEADAGFAFAGSTESGPFSLEIFFSSPPVGELCASAPLLTAPPAGPQLLSGFENNYILDDMSCISSENEDRVYDVSVPPGKTLTVTVTPIMMADPVLNLIEGTMCSDTSICLASSDGDAQADAEVATFVNASTAAKIVSIVVSSFNPADPGDSFTLNYTLTP
jgi:hypothetical protein